MIQTSSPDTCVDDPHSTPEGGTSFHSADRDRQEITSQTRPPIWAVPRRAFRRAFESWRRGDCKPGTAFQIQQTRHRKQDISSCYTPCNAVTRECNTSGQIGQGVTRSVTSRDRKNIKYVERRLYVYRPARPPAGIAFTVSPGTFNPVPWLPGVSRCCPCHAIVQQYQRLSVPHVLLVYQGSRTMRLSGPSMMRAALL